MTYPTVIRFGVATANIQNLTDLSRPDTRTAIASVKNQAGIIGFQETIEREDNEDIDAVFSPKEYHHFADRSENDIVVRKSRWGLIDKAPEGSFTIKDHLYQLATNAVIEIGTSRKHVQPQRTACYAILKWLENPLFTPLGELDMHLISGVDSHKEPRDYRLQERQDQYAEAKEIVLALKNAGVTVIITTDSNWKKMPAFTSETRRLVNGTIDKIWVEPGVGANFDLGLIDAAPQLQVERYDNPSDHDAWVANMEARANSLYVPPTPSIEERFAQIVKDYKISAVAEQKLRDLFAEV